MIGKRIYLTASDLKFCIDIGKQRNAQNVLENKRNMRYSRDSDDIISIRGVVGEYAFNKLFGLSQDSLCDTHCRNVQTDVDQDATLDDLKIDIKCTYWTPAPIKVMKHKRKYSANLYALMIIHRDPGCHTEYEYSDKVWCEFKGFVHPDVLFDSYNLTQDGRYYVVAQDKLVELEHAKLGTEYENPNTFF